MIRRPTQQTGVLAISMILIAAALLSTGCSFSGSQEEDATPTPIPTSIVPEKPTYTVRRGEVTEVLEFSGRVAPVVEEQLAFRMPGFVATIDVMGDQWVEAGDLLAELEVSDLKDQLAEAEAGLESALSQHKQQVADGQAALRAAELNLAIAEARNPSPQVAVATVALRQARAAQEAAGQDEQAELDLALAQANYEQALQAQQVYSYTVQLREQDVALAQMRLDRLESGVDVEEMRLAVERLKAQLEDARLVAPFAGQVLAITIREGQQVDAFAPAMVLIDPSELEVRANLTDSQLTRLAEGMPVTATAYGSSADEMQGYILSLPYPYGGGGQSGSAEDFAATRVMLESAVIEDEFELGDIVNMVVVLEHKEDVLWLPEQAIRNFEGRRFVVVQDTTGQMRKDVKIGIEGEGRVEIIEGLTEGEVVIGQ